MNWADLFSSTEYDIPMDVEPGSMFAGGDGYPDAEVKSSHVAPAKAILVQRIEIEATDHDTKTQALMVYRVVAVNELGEMVEIHRRAVPMAPGQVDVSRCAGCGGSIPEGQAVVIGGQAYHKRCVDEEEVDDGVAHLGGGLSVLRSPVRAGGPFEQGRRQGQKARADGMARQAEATTVTVVASDDGISASHMVTIARLDDDTDLVTLWAREFGGRSGTVRGRWPNGLCQMDIPRDCDVAYVNEKFFGERLATAMDVRIWTLMYREAMSKIGAGERPEG